MLLQIIVGVLCVVAALLQIALYLDHKVVDNRTRVVARRILGLGFALSAVYIFSDLYEYGYANTMVCLIAGLNALASSLFALDALFPNGEFMVKAHPKDVKHATADHS